MYLYILSRVGPKAVTGPDQLKEYCAGLAHCITWKVHMMTGMSTAAHKPFFNHYIVNRRHFIQFYVVYQPTNWMLVRNIVVHTTKYLSASSPAICSQSLMNLMFKRHHKNTLCSTSEWYITADTKGKLGYMQVNVLQPYL